MITFSVCKSSQVADSIDYPHRDFWFPWEIFRSNSVECNAEEHEDLMEKFHMLECYSVRENRVEEGAVV